ncbi:7350_t:CDS:1 [Cetraspora pellucida]|uniref:7350_t:CDS:1 n=1 Tax=Cetraspora pellucida TaxID=1433469 RepID=A0A9N8VTC5_9GLOM|nr:7350_t:CDS:1 [Cetraspora pellucida]
MSQIRSELLHSQNIATIDKLLKIYKQNIATLFEQISHDNNSKEEFILSDEDTDNDYINMKDVRDSDHIETVKCVDNWKVIVKCWINLTEDNDHMQYNSASLDESENLDNLYDEDEVIYQNYLLHPADNLEAKWKLTDTFVDSLVQPNSIYLLLGD